MNNKKQNNQPRIMGKNTISHISFSNNLSPQPIERNKGNRRGSDAMVMYGDAPFNLYPNFLLSLYNNSSIHKGIINSKVDYILGDGIVYTGTDQIAEFPVNDEQDVTDLVRRITKDYLIFHYYAIEVIYNSVGEIVQLNHIPAQNIRTNKNHSKFWFCDDWYENANNVIEFEGWNKDVNEDFTSKIYFHSAYTPSVNNTYPAPEYSGAIKSIENSIAINDFHANNLNNGFSPSTVITFHQGTPTEEIQAHTEKNIKENLSGHTGQKIIVAYAGENDKSTDVQQLSSGDWNDAFLSLKESTHTDIIVGHSLTSPLLAGISVAGQLGANSELETAYEIFRNLYVLNKREEIVNSINRLLEGTFKEIDILDNPKLFRKELDSSILVQILSIDELREMANMQPLPDGLGAGLLKPVVQTPNNMQPTVATPSNFSKDHDEEDEDEDVKKFNSISHLGYSKDDYVHLRKHAFSKQLKFGEDSRLTNYLVEKSPYVGKSLSDIRTALDNVYSLQEIREEIARLVVAKVIPSTKIIDNIDVDKAKKDLDVETIDTKPNYERIEVQYSYDGPADDKNRAFCARLVRADKYYSREDIQSMSDILGFDIFQHKGGKNCRHSWNAHSVVKKGGTK